MKLSKVSFLVLLALLLAVSGCRSRVIKVIVSNASQQRISTIIVDYPGATFGKDSLMPGETFPYVIKPVETSALKVQFSDAQGTSHAYVGPILHKNQEGTIEIKLMQNSASFSPPL